MKTLTPALKGAKRTADNKTQRLKHAATLSRSKTATEICTELGMSKRTLQRYIADPLWQAHGGVPLTFTQRGRPKRTTLSPAEKQRIAEAHTLHDQGRTWVQVAAELEMTIRQLEYLLEKDTEKSELDPLKPAERGVLQQAYRLHDAGMKWKAIPAELGITPNRLRYLRRKCEKTGTP